MPQNPRSRKHRSDGEYEADDDHGHADDGADHGEADDHPDDHEDKADRQQDHTSRQLEWQREQFAHP